MIMGVYITKAQLATLAKLDAAKDKAEAVIYDAVSDLLAALEAGEKALAVTLPRSDTDAFRALESMRAAIAKTRGLSPHKRG
jgi:hypothetical protein